MGDNYNSYRNSNAKGQSGANQGNPSMFNRRNTDNATMNQERVDATKQFVDKSIEQYDRLFSTVKENHKKFLGDKNDPDSIVGSEFKAVEDIKKAYEDMWKEVSESRSRAFADISDATNPSSGNANIVNVNTANIEKILKNIADVLNSGAVGGGNSNGTGSGRTGRNRLNDTEQQSDFQRSFVKVSDKVLEINELIANEFVQGRESQRIVRFGLKSLESLVSLVANFRDQEKMADSVVGLIVLILKQVIGFMSDAMMDHYNTQEEIFTNYMIFMRGTDRNLGYLRDEREFGNKLAELNLENNIRTTDLMKKSVDLATKGLSADEARSAALDSAIYGLIAPSLNTTSDIFLDLQTRGLKNITDSMAGIIESVRSTAGSSRLATMAMNTIVDKLGPIELYAQKGLLSGDAAQMLSDLEQMGYSTADAMELVNTVLDAYNDPYKALTSGSTMAKLVAEQYASQNIETLTQGKDLILEMLDTFTSGLDLEDIVDRSAIYNAVGLNINPRFRQTTEGEPTEMKVTPEEAYARMLEQLSGDQYQTFNELQTIAVTNTEMAMGLNTVIREFGDMLTNIVDAVCDIADHLVGSNRNEQRDINRMYDKAVETLNTDNTTLGKLTALSQLSEAISLEYNSSSATQERKEELEAQYALIQGKYAKYKSWLSPQELQQLSGLSSLNWWKEGDYAESNRDYHTENTANLPNQLAYEARDDGLNGAAKGAYLTTATPLIAGEAGPEFVIPEQKLIDTIGTGIDQYILANNPKPDYSMIITAMYNVASELITAINNNNSNTKLDTNTGLMNSSLSPLMGGN